MTISDYFTFQLQLATKDEDSVCFYAQLQFLVYAKLPAHPDLGTKEDISALLAIVRICDTSGDATRSRVWYQKLGDFQAVHVNTIQNVVGRVKVGNRWGIVDVSLSCERTSFIAVEDVDPDESDGE